jgi:hypothetical protein
MDESRGTSAHVCGNFKDFFLQIHKFSGAASQQ